MIRLWSLAISGRDHRIRRCIVYCAALVLPTSTNPPAHLFRMPRSHLAPTSGNDSQRAGAEVNAPPPSFKAVRPAQAQLLEPASTPRRASPESRVRPPCASRVLPGDCVAQSDATIASFPPPPGRRRWAGGKPPKGAAVVRRKMATSGGDEAAAPAPAPGAPATGSTTTPGWEVAVRPLLSASYSAFEMKELPQLVASVIERYRAAAPARRAPGGGGEGAPDRPDPLPRSPLEAWRPLPQPRLRGSRIQADEGLSRAPSAGPCKLSVPRFPFRAKLLRTPSGEGVVGPVWE